MLEPWTSRLLSDRPENSGRVFPFSTNGLEISGPSLGGRAMKRFNLIGTQMLTVCLLRTRPNSRKRCEMDNSLFGSLSPVQFSGNPTLTHHYYPICQGQNLR